MSKSKRDQEFDKLHGKAMPKKESKLADHAKKEADEAFRLAEGAGKHVAEEAQTEASGAWNWYLRQNLPKQVAIGAGVVIACIVLFNLIF